MNVRLYLTFMKYQPMFSYITDLVNVEAQIVPYIVSVFLTIVFY